MSRSQERNDEVLQRALQKRLAKGLADPRVRGLISVTRTSLSPDRADARVWISVLPEAHAQLTLHGLQAAAAKIRKELGETVRMRRLPRLHFLLDDSIKKEAQVLRAIDEGRARDRDAGTNEETTP
ncbi:MAG: 30S ribosome-binding factor RbfA [Phycisphaerales bacterium]|nr:30S ribosome-binding factor RbfA [Phycisphaerales bacterium]